MPEDKDALTSAFAKFDAVDQAAEQRAKEKAADVAIDGAQEEAWALKFESKSRLAIEEAVIQINSAPMVEGRGFRLRKINEAPLSSFVYQLSNGDKGLPFMIGFCRLNGFVTVNLVADAQHPDEPADDNRFETVRCLLDDLSVDIARNAITQYIDGFLSFFRDSEDGDDAAS